MQQSYGKLPRDDLRCCDLLEARDGRLHIVRERILWLYCPLWRREPAGLALSLPPASFRLSLSLAPFCPFLSPPFRLFLSPPSCRLSLSLASFCLSLSPSFCLFLSPPSFRLSLPPASFRLFLSPALFRLSLSLALSLFCVWICLYSIQFI